jgi:hypothetical protein
VLAGVECLQRHLEMGRRRTGDDDGVEARVLQELLVVGVGRADAMVRRCPVELLLRRRAESEDVPSLLLERRDVPVYADVEADDRDGGLAGDHGASPEVLSEVRTDVATPSRRRRAKKPGAALA